MSELKPCQMTTDEAIGALRGLKMMVGAVGKEALDIAISALRRAQPDNAPLTLEELRGMVGEWVWVEHMESSASLAAPGEWLKLKTCEPTRLDPYISFESKGLCALYYGKSWRAYRRKPEPEGGDPHAQR